MNASSIIILFRYATSNSQSFEKNFFFFFFQTNRSRKDVHSKNGWNIKNDHFKKEIQTCTPLAKWWLTTLFFFFFFPNIFNLFRILLFKFCFLFKRNKLTKIVFWVCLSDFKDLFSSLPKTLAANKKKKCLMFHNSKFDCLLLATYFVHTNQILKYKH